MKRNLLPLCCLLLAVGLASRAFAQTFTPTLSVQGILKKANGSAVDDGTYALTFKLYKQASGGTPLWTETQDGVEVSSGIYSVILGKKDTIKAPFNEQYYLGVSVGAVEMTPRLELTTFPYAMALLGSSNQFPSAGKVLADSIAVKGSVLAGSGAPGLNGANKKGYAFSDEKDSGLFSKANGQASLYADNTEALRAQKDSLTAYGNLKFESTNGLQYNNLNDWRLVDVDYLENGSNDGWSVCINPGNEFGDAYNVWRYAIGHMYCNSPVVVDFGNFAGTALRTTSSNDDPKRTFAFRKQFQPPGPYTYIKVKFRAFLLDSWDNDQDNSTDYAWAGFAKEMNANATAQIGWLFEPVNHRSAAFFYDGRGVFNLPGSNANWGDSWRDVEMTARYPSSEGPFWVIFGVFFNGLARDESFAVGGIEIWVK